MLRSFLLVAVVLSVGMSFEVYAQDAAQKTRELTAALDKTKYKKKEKPNVSIEIYIDIKNQAAVRNSVTDYGGHYQSDGYQLDLQVSKDGAASGEGFDIRAGISERSRFTLRDARIQGALLTGTKVYDGGQTEAFEAVFVDRTVSTGKNANQIESQQKMFGLGFIQTNGVDWTNRVFLEKR